MDTTASTLGEDTVEMDVSLLDAQLDDAATQLEDAAGSQPVSPPWQHLGAIVAGVVTLCCFALLVGPEAQAGDERGCYVARYANPADYATCGTGGR